MLSETFQRLTASEEGKFVSILLFLPETPHIVFSSEPSDLFLPPDPHIPTQGTATPHPRIQGGDVWTLILIPSDLKSLKTYEDQESSQTVSLLQAVTEILTERKKGRKKQRKKEKEINEFESPIQTTSVSSFRKSFVGRKYLKKPSDTAFSIRCITLLLIMSNKASTTFQIWFSVSNISLVQWYILMMLW